MRTMIAKATPIEPQMIPARAIPPPGRFFFFAMIPVMIAPIPSGMLQGLQQQSTIVAIPRQRDTIESAFEPCDSGE